MPTVTELPHTESNDRLQRFDILLQVENLIFFNLNLQVSTKRYID